MQNAIRPCALADHFAVCCAAISGFANIMTKSPKRMRTFFFFFLPVVDSLFLLSLPQAFLNRVHTAHNSGTVPGFNVSGVKGQRLLNPVAVLGLYVVMDG